MKLRKLFLSLLCGVTFLSSCGNTGEDSKIDFSIGDKTLTTFVEASQDKIDSMIENEDSFIAYVYSPSCSICTSVSPRIEEIIQEYGITVYRIAYSNLDSSSPLRLTSGAPILGFYKDGKRLRVIGYTDRTTQDFSSKDNLVKLFSNYVILPQNIYYVSLEELLRMKNASNSFVVIFSRESCSDCSMMNRVFFNEYARKNIAKHIYLLECDVEGIRFSKGEGDELVYNEAQWIEFKSTWGLSEQGNATYGYNAGYVPTIQYYESGELAGSYVYLNDSYETSPTGEESEGKRVTYTITITDSASLNFIGTTYNVTLTYRADSINSDLYNAYRNSAISYHNEHLEAFLDQYAK